MVDVNHINNVLAQPDQVTVDHIALLQETLIKFPYFQAARSIYLKGLKNESSPLYNKELQRTASHTTDRSVLFDFITSDSFIQNKVSEQIKQLREEEKENENVENTLSTTPEVLAIQKPIEEDFNASTDFTQVTDIDLFEKKKSTSIADEPLEFNKNETYSFSQWLQLTSLQPIDRTTQIEDEKQVTSKKEEEINENLISSEIIQEEDDRARKMARIDQFLAEKPKIKPRKSPSPSINVANQYQDPSQFMTETLAKVYLAQKNYSKALKAYEILVLQHPEKSGLFADQIQEIKNLQSNNT
ncbi:hypothetical protein LY01_02118 [Nonlabens xylanidelens]|uniref:Tetratricopeptide repeat protein n=1 Tax=Nonlabens xylanidelens TaxID=191564 RepID=A0A2S6IJU9_9FLAO|nr:hypothetical protein [Nonlabens xylanidelens]PPK94478.1 hypothetical protein LY01_02118 [Nonlabens xylanidelens]PQJ21364.1 hypothetical protein BST94_04005 [Nonlabens xylanidelens]